MAKVAVWSWRNFINHTPPHLLLVYGFAALILTGTLLLRLPHFQNPGHFTGWLDCFFMTTSAACVTGLVTVSLTDNFNFWGQLVVLLICQAGGLGVMTFAAISFKLIGSRLSLRSQAALEDSLFQRDAAKEFQKTFHYIFYIVFLIELAGAVCLTAEQWGRLPWTEAIWSGIFHSISAFCNAGFSLWNNSLAGQGSLFLLTITALSVLGGLGHIVLVELARVFKYNILKRQRIGAYWFSYHTRVVLIVTAALLTVGTLAILWLGTGDGQDPLVSAIFESASARTSGFCTHSQALLPIPTALFMIFLMFVGGSPGSCAGGIKTTSFAIWMCNVLSALFRRDEATLLGRNIPPDIVFRARQLINLAFLWNAMGFFILSLVEPDAPLMRIIFEQISAFGTVGLSMDFTSTLSPAGKIWIVLSMFIGRLGPLTIALSMLKTREGNISHPEGRIMIG